LLLLIGWFLFLSSF